MIELDSLTLDQIRLFVCVVDEGSFSAAARKLRRAQSAVSYGIGNLETHLGVLLFNRSTRRPTLTTNGEGLLADAKQVLHGVNQLGARAAAVSSGLELEVRLAVSAICPTELLIAMGRAFQKKYPQVSLRVQTEVMEAVPALVLDGTCHLGISGPFALNESELERRFLTHIHMVPVAGPGHALAQKRAALTRAEVHTEVQIVITQRSRTSQNEAQSVFSATTWHVADAATKLELIRAGLGWGFLPMHLVHGDIEQGRLARLELAQQGPAAVEIPLAGITRSGFPPGPAGRWLLDEMGAICQRQSSFDFDTQPG